MSRTLPAFLGLVLALSAVPAFAGGDGDRIRIVELQRLSDTAYRLVFDPAAGSTFWGECARITVHGDFRRLRGAFPWYRGVSRQDHLDALEYLRANARDNREVFFGIMGGGLESVDAAHPCEKRSRALKLFENEGGGTGVYSYHDVV